MNGRPTGDAPPEEGHPKVQTKAVNPELSMLQWLRTSWDVFPESRARVAEMGMSRLTTTRDVNAHKVFEQAVLPAILPAILLVILATITPAISIAAPVVCCMLTGLSLQVLSST